MILGIRDIFFGESREILGESLGESRKDFGRINHADFNLINGDLKWKFMGDFG